MHCPQCGQTIVKGARVCGVCGAAVQDAASRQALDKARTMVGVVSPELLPKAQPGQADVVTTRTLMGMPEQAKQEVHNEARALAGTLVGGTPAFMAQSQPPRQQQQEDASIGVGRDSAFAGPSIGQKTLVGHAPPTASPIPGNDKRLSKPSPGIAPLAPTRPDSVAPTRPDSLAPTQPDPDREYEPLKELGATIAPQDHAWKKALQKPPLKLQKLHRLDRPRKQERQVKKKPASRPRMVIVLGLATLVATATAVLVVVLWPTQPLLTARAQLDETGRDVVALRCETCPDGTTVRIGQAEASFASQSAQIPLATPLPLGETRLRVVVERPPPSRRQTVEVLVHVAYRIQSDLGTLKGERPSIQVVVEATPGTDFILNGKPLSLVGNRAIEVLDVTDALTGPTTETKTLDRQVPYLVTPPDEAQQQGLIKFSVPIVPLWIEAPGPRIVIDQQTFVLEGFTAKGAQLFAGTYPVPVREDGTFSHPMNVSSVGTTQVEVRAKMQGMAPRLAKIGVRRVDRLETAAKDFMASGPISETELTRDPKGQIGKPIVVKGQVLESKLKGHTTTLLLAPSKPCPAAYPICRVRLVHGIKDAAKPGDWVAAYGHVAPSLPSPDEALAEVQVEFIVHEPQGQDSLLLRRK